jgi:hypothetical protein
MFAIVGVLAVVIDGGMLMSERRQSQSVADAAALAAAYSLYNNYSTNQGADPNGAAAKEARSIASDNGFANDGTISTVTVNIPPTSGSFKSTSGYAEVIVQYGQSRYFSSMWDSGLMSVTARSVARGIANTSSPAILLLDPTMSKALNMTANGNVNVTGGSIVIDSNNSQAGFLTGSGNAVATNINIYGNYSTSASGKLVGTVKTGVSPTADPLSSLAVPDPTTLTLRSSSNYKISSSGTYTLQPGLYTGGISVSAPTGTITLSSGLYYMQGGGFQLSGNINITGSGVTIYNAPVHNSETVSLTSGGSVTLSAPTSGTYKGITIFQARSATAQVSITGNGSMNLTGTIYAAGGNLNLTSNGSSNTIGSQIITDSLTVTGNGSVNVNYPSSGSPARDTRSVE